MKHSLSPTSTSLSRRDFLAVCGMTAAAGAASQAILSGSAHAAERTPGAPAAGSKRIPIGLELYSVRGELSKDLPNTLKTVAKMGYEVVEFYAPYFKWTLPYAKEVRATR